MISYLFVILAAICNAVMDNITHHWYKSVFNKLSPTFWNPEISWYWIKPIPIIKYRCDAWHIFKSLMIIFMVLAILTYEKSIVIHPIMPILEFIAYGICWNATFNFMYNHLLNRKQ